MDRYEVLRTDVLIIGGGGAGVRAAIETKNRDVEVCLLCKGPIARSGLTPLATYGIQAAFGIVDRRDNPEIHYQDIIVQGTYLANRNLARVLADEIIARIHDLERFGIRFKKKDGEFVQLHHPGQTYPRSLFLFGGGFGLVNGLKGELYRHPKLKIFEDFHVSRLLLDQGEVVGAFGLSLRDGRFYAFHAKSVILACGGYEELWKNTDTAPDSTGDGVYLGFSAGADVIDLEMIQYYPTVLAYPESVRGILIDYETLLAEEHLDFRLVNNEGREFLQKDLFPTRDTLMRAIFAEIKAGRGTSHNAVFIDPSRSSKSFEEIDGLIKELLKHPFKNLKKLGIDLRKDRIEVCPAVHYTLGGVHINEETGTSVRGLFAAGENSGNVHGADRISGNSLAEIQVFGARAGQYASEYARKRSHAHLPVREIREEIQRWNSFKQRKKEGIRPLILRKEMKNVMERYVSANRTELGMKKALEMVLDLKKNGLPKVEVAGGRIFNVDWRMAIEVSMSLDLAELLIRSALFRKETRGHHLRKDFPMTLETPHHTLVRKEGQEIYVTSTPVRELNS